MTPIRLVPGGLLALALALAPAATGAYSETPGFVSVLVVNGVMRDVTLSLGWGCLVDDLSDAGGTTLVFTCHPDDETLTACVSTEVEVTQAGGGVQASASCGLGLPATCAAAFPAGNCTAAGPGGDLPFRCSIRATNPVVTYRAYCYAYF